MRGVTIAIFLLCVSVFGTFMAAGVNGALGMSMDNGLEEPADRTTKNISGEQDVGDQGGGGGLLGYVTYGMRVLNNFGRLFGSIGAQLNTWSGGRFSVLWMGIQSIVVVIGVLMLVWVARGIIGE